MLVTIQSTTWMIPHEAGRGLPWAYMAINSPSPQNDFPVVLQSEADDLPNNLSSSLISVLDSASWGFHVAKGREEKSKCEGKKTISPPLKGSASVC